MNRLAKLLPWVALAALAVGPGSAAAQDGYALGVSNTVQGNGWREEMICAIKAQALASGKVGSLNIAHRNTDAAGQLEDIRNLIGAGVDAIIG
jgi:ribose transport system substrate-binding protein